MTRRNGDGPRSTRGPAENETSTTGKQLGLFEKGSRPHSTAAAERGEWLRQLVAAVARRAARPGPFTMFDVAVESRLPEPGHHSMWGVGMGICHREGLVIAVAAVPSARPRTARSLVRQWVGTRHAQGGDAA